MIFFGSIFQPLEYLGFLERKLSKEGGSLALLSIQLDLFLSSLPYVLNAGLVGVAIMIHLKFSLESRNLPGATNNNR